MGGWSSFLDKVGDFCLNSDFSNWLDDVNKGVINFGADSIDAVGKMQDMLNGIPMDMEAPPLSIEDLASDFSVDFLHNIGNGESLSDAFGHVADDYVNKIELYVSSAKNELAEFTEEIDDIEMEL
ncbi:hypothetical protein FACS1894219_04450 [Clostridia bacterium]|nr:hypothetical protein FACS1894219_04450 [Clostridia bacterium]